MKQGCQVRAFVRYNSKNHWGWLDTLENKSEMEVISGDIRDYDSVYRAVQGVDTVFHLAALIGIPYSYTSPLAYVKTNIEGTYNVLQAALKNEIPNIIVTSTSEVYGTAQYVPIDERHPLVGQSPYSATKISADQLAISYFRSFNLPVKIARPFNTYGPRQSARAFIPNVIIQILNGAKKIKVGNLQTTRDLTFVKDTVAGFIAIAEAENLNGEVTNIGMNQEISMLELADKIASQMGHEIEFDIQDERVRPDKSEVERLCCNNGKVLGKTQWNPAYTLNTGLLETIEWFRSNKNHYKSTLYNV